MKDKLNLYSYPQQKTTRAYLHPYRSSRLVMFMRDHKIVNLELRMDTHYGQKGASLLLLGEDLEMLPFRESGFAPVVGGIPCLTLSSDAKNGARITMQAFCDDCENPKTYISVTVTNPGDRMLSGSVSFLPATADNDKYLTGLWDTGYMAYDPNPRALTMLDQEYAFRDGILSDGYAQTVFSDPERLSYTGAQDDLFAFSHYVTLPYTLVPGEKTSVSACFSLCSSSSPVLPYAQAKERAYAYWRGLLSHVKLRPDTDDEMLQNIYDYQLVQDLQMIAVYSDGTVFPRQGCIGRFVWAWEAAHFLSLLDRVGLSDYTVESNRTLLEKWMITDKTSENYGKIDNPRVNWANTNGSVLWSVADHLTYVHDETLLAEFFPYLEAAVAWIEKRRHENRPGEVPGLFPSAVASDWAEVGQHYTYTDSVNVMGYRKLAAMLKAYGHPAYETYQALYEDYYAVLQSAMDDLIRDVPDDADFMPTHILGKPFRDVRTHCYTTDGTVYLPQLGNLDVNSRFFGFIERFYEKHGLLDSPLLARMTNLDFGDPSVYGDCYYSSDAEFAWFYIYLQKNDRARAKDMLDSMLYFNMTTEYIAAERWTPRTVWYAPWQPNASASARLATALLDYYGEKPV